jgi:pimeloyl-ACP methyl ester carboxylesterase
MKNNQINTLRACPRIFTRTFFKPERDLFKQSQIVQIKIKKKVGLSQHENSENVCNQKLNMTNRTIETRLGKIEYASVGNGIPIIFIHGGHSNCNETLFHKGFDLNRHQLITPSRPGYGNTPLNNNRTPGQSADLIAELISHLSIKKCVVYGISAGGLTAIELAAGHPDKVEKLILASAISKKWLDKNASTYKTARIIFNPKMEKFTWGIVRGFSKIFPGMIAKSFYAQFSLQPKHKLDKNDVAGLVSALMGYRSKSGFMNDIDQEIDSNVFGKIKCPALIVHSKNDNSVSLDHALNSNKKIENSKLIELDNEWGHLFWIGKDSEQSINRIIAFIDER